MLPVNLNISSECLSKLRKVMSMTQLSQGLIIRVMLENYLGTANSLEKEQFKLLKSIMQKTVNKPAGGGNEKTKK